MQHECTYQDTNVSKTIVTEVIEHMSCMYLKPSLRKLSNICLACSILSHCVKKAIGNACKGSFSMGALKSPVSLIGMEIESECMSVMINT